MRHSDYYIQRVIGEALHGDATKAKQFDIMPKESFGMGDWFRIEHPVTGERWIIQVERQSNRQ